MTFIQEFKKGDLVCIIGKPDQVAKVTYVFESGSVAVDAPLDGACQFLHDPEDLEKADEDDTPIKP